MKDVKTNIDAERLMQNIDLEEIQQHVVDGVQESLKSQFEGLKDDVGIRAIQLYGICTGASVFLDFTCLCLIITYFGHEKGHMEQKIALVLLNVSFWYCFYKWGAFARTLKSKLPAGV